MSSAIRSTILTRSNRFASRLFPLSILTLFLTAASFARASAYEPFDYPVGPQSTAWTGGTGFADGNNPATMPNGWYGGATSLPGSLGDPTGTLATSGNHVQLRDINRRLAQTLGAPGTDVWISWLQRRSENSVGFQGLKLQQPIGDSGAGGLYFIGEPGIGPGDNTFVIGAAGDDFNVVSSGVPVVPDQTAFLVAHLQFRDGKDLATLYVNPTPGASEPVNGVTYSGLDMPTLNPLVAFQSSANNPQVTHEFDELRIGDSYAAVAPLVPEPSAAAAILLFAATPLLTRRQAGGAATKE